MNIRPRVLFFVLLLATFVASPVSAQTLPFPHIQERLWESLEPWINPLQSLFASASLSLHHDQEQWPMPHATSWAMDENGLPIVETERVDELWHTLTRRHDLRWFRQRFHTSAQELQALNPDLDISDLKEGQTVLAWRRKEDTLSKGVGDPNRGRLKFGEPLPLADKYVILHRHRSFGTYYATSELKRIFDEYAVAFPEANPVMMGDLSFRRGRRIIPHRSHHTGRDVDISYPRLDEAPTYTRFHYIRRSELDAPRLLWLLKQMLAGGLIEYAFMDRWVQKKLYKEAKRQGAPDAWLEAVFQYPKWSGLKFVRRSPGHDDHMHIRFYRQATDN